MHVLPQGTNLKGGTAYLDGDRSGAVTGEGFDQVDDGPAIGFLEGELVGDGPGCIDALEQRTAHELEGIAQVPLLGGGQGNQPVELGVVGVDSTWIEAQRMSIAGEVVLLPLDPQLLP